MDNNLGFQEATVQLAQKGYAPAVAYNYFCDGKYSRAIDDCLKLLATEPDLVSVRVVLARSLFHSGQFENARKQFLAILKTDDANLRALKYLGDIAFKEGQEATAMAYYRRVFELDRFCRGLFSELNDRQTETVRTQSLTIRKKSETVAPRRLKPLQEPAFVTETVADIYMEQGYFRLAEEVYNRLLSGGNEERIAVKLRAAEEKIKVKGRE